MTVAPTSVSAYMNEVAPTLGARQITVMELFERDTDRDYSNSEIAEALGWKINQVTGRVNELRKFGVLVFSQFRQCRQTGRRVNAWKLKTALTFTSKAFAQQPVTHVQFPSRSERGRTQTVKLNGTSAVCTCRGFYFRQDCKHVREALDRAPAPEEVMSKLF